MKNVDPKKVYTRRQILELGFDTFEYKYLERAGVLFGNLDNRCYGKNSNMLLFFTLNSGEKVVICVYRKYDYRGFRDIDNGSYCKLYVGFTNTGKAKITRADVLDTGGGHH